MEVRQYPAALYILFRASFSIFWFWFSVHVEKAWFPVNLPILNLVVILNGLNPERAIANPKRSVSSSLTHHG